MSGAWRAPVVAALLLTAPALRDDSKDVCLALTLWDPDPQSWWVLIVSPFLLALLICENPEGLDQGYFPSRQGLYLLLLRGRVLS